MYYKGSFRGVVALGACFGIWCGSQWAFALDYQLVPLDMGSGFTMAGSISTDGTIGVLNASHITNWNITATSVSDIVFNRSNTSNFSISVSSTGSQLTVSTSPDGFSDGGSIWFRAGTYQQVQVADFTGSNTSGGQAFYAQGSALGFLPLNQPNGIQYTAAVIDAGGGNRFNLLPLDFGSGIVMSGWITTDGATGPARFVDWSILVRETVQWNFNPTNSHVIGDFNLATNGNEFTVTPFDVNGSPGQFMIGRGSMDITAAVLADFSIYPSGQAGLITPQIYQMLSPLPLNQNGDYVVATAVPDPECWIGLGFGVMALVMYRRRQ